jgi:Transposase DDE domain group 1
LGVQATNSSSRVEVTTDGTGVVGHAGAALLRELADRVGLTGALGWRDPQGRRHPDAAVLRDLAVMLADGGDCLSDLAVLRDQPELFGPVARPRPPGGWWNARPATLMGWPGCGPLGRMPAPGRGWPGPTRSWSCWSSTRTRPWCWPTATPRKARRAPTRARSGSIPCWRTWIAGPPRANRWLACSGRATPQPVAAMT